VPLFLSGTVGSGQTSPRQSTHSNSIQLSKPQHTRINMRRSKKAKGRKSNVRELYGTSIPLSSRFHVGQEVDVYAEGEGWYLSSIVEVKKDHIRVHYHGWHASHDCDLPADVVDSMVAPAYTHVERSALDDGRGFVNDYTCDLCAQGGDLVLCDSCPKVFHADCINISQADLPEQFYCAFCMLKRQQAERAAMENDERRPGVEAHPYTIDSSPAADSSSPPPLLPFSASPDTVAASAASAAAASSPPMPDHDPADDDDASCGVSSHDSDEPNMGAAGAAAASAAAGSRDSIDLAVSPVDHTDDDDMLDDPYHMTDGFGFPTIQEDPCGICRTFGGVTSCQNCDGKYHVECLSEKQTVDPTFVLCPECIKNYHSAKLGNKQKEREREREHQQKQKTKKGRPKPKHTDEESSSITAPSHKHSKRRNGTSASALKEVSKSRKSKKSIQSSSSAAAAASARASRSSHSSVGVMAIPFPRPSNVPRKPKLHPNAVASLRIYLRTIHHLLVHQRHLLTRVREEDERKGWTLQRQMENETRKHEAEANAEIQLRDIKTAELKLQEKITHAAMTGVAGPPLSSPSITQTAASNSSAQQSHDSISASLSSATGVASSSLLPPDHRDRPAQYATPSSAAAASSSAASPDVGLRAFLRESCLCIDLFGADRSTGSNPLTAEEADICKLRLQLARDQHHNIVVQLEKHVELLDVEWMNEIAAYTARKYDACAEVALAQSDAGLVHLSRQDLEAALQTDNPKHDRVRKELDKLKQLESEFSRMQAAMDRRFHHPFAEFEENDRYYQTLEDCWVYLKYHGRSSADVQRILEEWWEGVNGMEPDDSCQAISFVTAPSASAAASSPTPAEPILFHTDTFCFRCGVDCGSAHQLAQHTRQEHMWRLYASKAELSAVRSSSSSTPASSVSVAAAAAVEAARATAAAADLSRLTGLLSSPGTSDVKQVMDECRAHLSPDDVKLMQQHLQDPNTAASFMQALKTTLDVMKAGSSGKKRSVAAGKDGEGGKVNKKRRTTGFTTLAAGAPSPSEVASFVSSLPQSTSAFYNTSSTFPSAAAQLDLLHLQSRLKWHTEQSQYCLRNARAAVTADVQAHWCNATQQHNFAVQSIRQLMATRNGKTIPHAHFMQSQPQPQPYTQPAPIYLPTVGQANAPIVMQAPPLSYAPPVSATAATVNPLIPPSRPTPIMSTTPALPVHVSVPASAPIAPATPIVAPHSAVSSSAAVSASPTHQTTVMPSKESGSNAVPTSSSAPVLVPVPATTSATASAAAVSVPAPAAADASTALGADLPTQRVDMRDEMKEKGGNASVSQAAQEQPLHAAPKGVPAPSANTTPVTASTSASASASVPAPDVDSASASASADVPSTPSILDPSALVGAGGPRIQAMLRDVMDPEVEMTEEWIKEFKQEREQTIKKLFW